jgi:predicted NBD/HSP70 family sugar kinase
MPGAIGNNPERSRTHNRRVVLDVVRLHGPIGRTDIARRARLTAQAVSNIVGELVAEGLLLEHGRRRSGRGQPPIQFSVNAGGAATIGIEIGARRLTAVAVDLGGGLRAQLRRSLAGTEPDVVVPQIAGAVAELKAALGPTPPALLGIGVVMPGPFGVEGLTSVGPTTLAGWAGLDAGALVEAATGEPVFVENDATAAAVGERLHGAARGFRTFCLVYFGQGLGLGILIDGRPFSGAFGNAGELGHVVVAPGGRACTCGNHGCLERYVSLEALQERLAAAGHAERGLDAIAALHAAGDPTVAAWIVEAAGHLRPQIATLENLLDPEAVLVGGVLPEAVIADLVAALKPLPLSVASRFRDSPRVITGTTGRLTAALGAAALPLFDTMTPRLQPAADPSDRHQEAPDHAD